MRKIKFTSNKQKKAELSLTVVVSAVLALVVLVVLIYIFTKNIGGGSKTFASCGLNGGKCSPAGTCGSSGKLEGLSCGEGQDCCQRTDWLCSDADFDAGKCKR